MTIRGLPSSRFSSCNMSSVATSRVRRPRAKAGISLVLRSIATKTTMAAAGELVLEEEVLEVQIATTPQVRDCHYIIPNSPRAGGSVILLDQCTGNTWRFDSGWEYSTYPDGSYVRPYSWQTIER